MAFFSRFRAGKQVSTATPIDQTAHQDEDSSSGERTHTRHDESPVPRLTFASVIMGILVSMGGFVFGYDTGEFRLHVSSNRLQ